MLVRIDQYSEAPMLQLPLLRKIGARVVLFLTSGNMAFAYAVLGSIGLLDESRNQHCTQGMELASTAKAGEER